MGLHLTPQVFHFTDLQAVLLLVLLEGLLSADNALVLALMVRHLPADQQKKALLYGLGGAFVFRFVAILTATFIIQLWWLQVIGAVYLAWISVKHFALLGKGEMEGEGEARNVRGKSFWATVIAVELTDIAFAVDSVIAAVAIESRMEKLWVVYCGAIIGVVLLRYAAGAFIKLLDRFPLLEHLAYGLILWVAVKLGMMAGHNFTRTDYGKATGLHIPEMPQLVFWSVMGVLIIGGSLWAVSQKRGKTEASETAEELPE